jgi:hypothetical protein
MRIGPTAAALTLGLSIAGSAHATVFVVGASANSSTGGVGLPSLTVTDGEQFTVTSSTDDLWSAGELPRFADGDGLVMDRFATASDDSGEPVGTLIAPFASLVGEIDGVYRELGANFSGAAWGTGTLNLYFWDQNSFDNSGTIAFDVSPASGGVPEPAAWAMMILGFGLAGGLLRARPRTAETAATA